MKFTEFVKMKKRMCYAHDCANCPFRPFLSDNTIYSFAVKCNAFCMNKPTEAIDALQKWLAENPQLDSCPFCGGEAAFHTESDRDIIYYGVMCKDNGKCGMIPALYKTKAEAVEAWNKRAVKE